MTSYNSILPSEIVLVISIEDVRKSCPRLNDDQLRAVLALSKHQIIGSFALDSIFKQQSFNTFFLDNTEDEDYYDDC